jgi:hypothetical protein
MTAQPDVLELTREQYEAFLAGEVDRWKHDLTLADFISAFRSGELDDRDPEVARLAALVGLGQNGR